jgi:hypothetical protein
MGLYNLLDLVIRCPHCRVESRMDADFRFGWMNLDRYHLGDRLLWDGGGVRVPRRRPPGGNFTGDAYAECPSCQRDFWLTVTVCDDVIERAEVDPTRKGYILPLEENNR